MITYTSLQDVPKTSGRSTTILPELVTKYAESLPAGFYMPAEFRKEIRILLESQELTNGTANKIAWAAQRLLIIHKNEKKKIVALESKNQLSPVKQVKQTKQAKQVS